MTKNFTTQIIKGISFLLISATLLNACKTPKSVSDKPLYDINKIKPAAGAIAQKSPLAKEFKKTTQKFAFDLEGLDSIKKEILRQAQIILNMDTVFNRMPQSQAKKILQSDYKALFPQLQDNFAQADVLQHQINDIIKLTQTGELNTIRDSILYQIYQDNTPNSNHLTKQQILNQFETQYNEIVNQKMQELISAKRAVISLYNAQNSVMFHIRLFEANLKLNRDLLILNNDSYFDLGIDTLNHNGQRELKRIVKTYLDTLTLIINQLSLPSKVNKDSIQLKFYCDGFTDYIDFTHSGTLKYNCKNQALPKDKTKRRKLLNQCLSENRSNYVLTLFLTEFKKYSLNIKIEFHSVKGNGEKLPYTDSTFVNNSRIREKSKSKKGDKSRRITVLQCIIEVKYENLASK